MTTEMPFSFGWCYEPDEDEETGHQNCLLLGTPDTVTLLHIDITNCLADPNKTITINPIEGVTQADATNYHFKLAFIAGILVEPGRISVESQNWSISFLSESTDSLYLLWTGEPTSLEPQDFTEVILTGVAGKSAVRTTTTDVTISWEFKQGNLDLIDVRRPEQGEEYDKNTTLTLEMIKTTGKSNIPLFVGFVGANQVLNTHNETNSLQLRITNTNLPNTPDPDITFHYDAVDVSKCSQLVVVLEVGDSNVLWALGTEDQVDDITISLDAQWQQKGTIEQIKVGEIVKALQWTFMPKSADVVLAPQETMLIDLENIITAHPTGATNLYLRYQYLEVYKDGQFICQIEKAPLVLDTKVHIGTRTERQGLLTVKDGITLNHPGEIQHTGPLIFRSDVDNLGDSSSVQFFNKQAEPTLLMELTSVGNLNLNQGSLNFPNSNKQVINLFDSKYGIGIQSYTTYFRTASHFAWYSGGSHNDTVLNPGDGGTVQMVINNGNVGIGTASPLAKLDVSGKIKGSGDLEVTGNTTISSGSLSFGSRAGQHLNLYSTAHTIGVQNNTTYFRTPHNFAWYKNGSHDNGELNPGGGTVQMVIKDGNVGIGTNDPKGKLDVHGGKIRINGGPVMKYQNYTWNGDDHRINTGYSSSEWIAAVVGVHHSLDEKHQWKGFVAIAYEENNIWIVRVDIEGQGPNEEKQGVVNVIFIRKELFD